MSYTKNRHEIGFLRTDGTTKIGLILAKDKLGNPIYQTWNDSFTQERYITSDVPGYGGLNPENEVRVGQNSWEAGLGKEMYASNSPKRSWDTRDLDTRVAYKAKAGLLDTAPTLPTLMTIVDGGMETWTDVNTLTNWTKTGGAVQLDREATIIDSGTYSAKVTNTDIYQNMTGYVSGTYAGKYVTVIARVRAAVAVSPLRIVDDAGTTTGTAHSGLSDFETITCTRKIDSTATYVRVLIGNTSVGGVAYIDTITTMTYSGTRPWAEFNDDHYFSSGNVLLKVEGADGTIKYIANFAADITWLEAFSDSRLYICLDNKYTSTQESGYASSTTALRLIDATLSPFLVTDIGKTVWNRTDNTTALITDFNSTSNVTIDTDIMVSGEAYTVYGIAYAYWYMDTAETCTQSTATEKTFNRMAMVRTTADTMYGSQHGNILRSTTNPLNGGTAWSTVTVVDSVYNEIMELLAYKNALYIMKEDRPYYLSAAGAVQTLTDSTVSLPRVTSTYSLQNGMNSCIWKGKLYMPYGNTLLEYDPDTTLFRWLHPSITCANSDYKDKLIVAVKGDEDYLYMLMQNGTTGYLFAGRDEVIDGVSQWVWHNIATLAATTGCQSLSVSSIYERRIWVGASVNTAIKYLKESVYVSAGYMETPYYHANFLGDVKAWIKMTLTMEDTTANVYWDASYKKLGDSSWTSIGSFKTSPRTTKYIPVDGSSVNPSSVWMKFKLDAITNSSASTPVLRDIDVRAVLYSSRRKMIECEVVCADDLTDKEGVKLEVNADKIATVLDEAADATYPVTFYDIYGTARTVKVLPIKPYSWVTKADKGRTIERRFHLLMQEVTTS